VLLRWPALIHPWTAQWPELFGEPSRRTAEAHGGDRGGRREMTGPCLTILRELAPYELGQGWPYMPGEGMDCRALSAAGYLTRRGRRFTITAKGRALVAAEG
jgi:hypothetical protein